MKSGELRLETPTGGTAILADLSEASFVDSSIIGVLLDGRRRAAGGSG